MGVLLRHPFKLINYRKQEQENIDRHRFLVQDGWSASQTLSQCQTRTTCSTSTRKEKAGSLRMLHNSDQKCEQKPEDMKYSIVSRRQNEKKNTNNLVKVIVAVKPTRQGFLNEGFLYRQNCESFAKRRRNIWTKVNGRQGKCCLLSWPNRVAIFLGNELASSLVRESHPTITPRRTYNYTDLQEINSYIIWRDFFFFFFFQVLLLFSPTTRLKPPDSLSP